MFIYHSDLTIYSFQEIFHKITQALHLYWLSQYQKYVCKIFSFYHLLTLILITFWLFNLFSTLQIQKTNIFHIILFQLKVNADNVLCWIIHMLTLKSNYKQNQVKLFFCYRQINLWFSLTLQMHKKSSISVSGWKTPELS